MMLKVVAPDMASYQDFSGVGFCSGWCGADGQHQLVPEAEEYDSTAIGPNQVGFSRMMKPYKVLLLKYLETTVMVALFATKMVSLATNPFLLFFVPTAACTTFR
jgi:hypothetical protein